MEKILPSEYKIIASIGHVRDLPQNSQSIPAKYKELPWGRLGVDVENNFTPLYVIPKGKTKVINEIKKLARQADEILLATDEDREGESISWHLVTILNPKIPVKRMVFHEITKNAILNSLDNFRDIDTNLVKAQEARRILDRLFGYTLSPVIWKKIAYGLSAGRVQSPSLRMLVQQERLRMKHTKTEYWDIIASLKQAKSPIVFSARLAQVDGVALVSSEDFDSHTGKRTNTAHKLLLQHEAQALADSIAGEVFTVREVTEKSLKEKPPIPFITSTLQQTANRKLGLSAQQTLRIAQSLYENGKITYMRTDNPSLSTEAIKIAREQVTDVVGSQYLSQTIPQFKGSGGEAHEAIRPAGTSWVLPQRSGLHGRELQLYRMIWQRTLASQMKPADKQSQKIILECKNTIFHASGMKIVFAGFLKIYGIHESDAQNDNDGTDDVMQGDDGASASSSGNARERLLPPLSVGTQCNAQALDIDQHSTRPPARYSEATLIQRLESEGIGRPSTYASIISTLIDRAYVQKIGNALVPTFTGMAVVQLLEQYFTSYVDYDFTSVMERTLDEIAQGKQDNIAYLKQFYLSGDGLQQTVSKQDPIINPELVRTLSLPHFAKDKSIEFKVGKYGPFIVAKRKVKNTLTDIHASLPNDIAPADLTTEQIEELIEMQIKGPSPIGHDPKTGQPIYVLSGRYGYYVQQGETEAESAEKPKRSSIPKNMDVRAITLEDAIRLLSIPRTLGVHPETNQPVIANTGRFGPYISHNNDNRSLRATDDVYTITLERALEILSQPKVGRKRSTKIRTIGSVPNTNKSIDLHQGMYGPYLKVGTKNISLPSELKDEKAISSLTLEQVLPLINS